MKKVLIYVPVVLVLGTLERVRALYELSQLRAEHGQPFARMIVILGCSNKESIRVR